MGQTKPTQLIAKRRRGSKLTAFTKLAIIDDLIAHSMPQVVAAKRHKVSESTVSKIAINLFSKHSYIEDLES